MRCRFLCLSVAVALLSLGAAQLKDLNEESFAAGDKSVVNRHLDCLCSPTSRGFSKKAVLPAKPADSTTAKANYDACVASASHEDCVNLDASRRPKDGVADTYCSYMVDTGSNGRNVVGAARPGQVRTVARCDMDDLSARDVPQDMPAGEDRVNKEDPEVKNEDGTKADGSSSTGGDSTANGSNGATRPQRNPHEGCVAIEHLAGHHLQHHPHLVRPVLCYDGFCATPNHALLVDGRWTSMRHLCAAQWSCVRSVKTVNNLKWRLNRRAVAVAHASSAHIVVTPYDLRFPRVGVVALQMLEDVYLLTLEVTKVAALAAVGVLVACRLA